MDFAQALYELWKRKLWLAVAAAVSVVAMFLAGYSVGVLPPKLESKSIAYGTASTEVLVDSARSSLAQLDIPVSALSERAQVYAELLRSDPVRNRIAKESGIPIDQIAIDGLTANSSPGTTPEPTAPERAAELRGEGAIRRLFFRVTPDQPIIQLISQGTDAADASNLANAAATALPDYLNDLQRSQGIEGPNEVELVQLGLARGGVIGAATDKVIMVVVGLAVFAVCCLLILLAPRLREGLYRAEMQDLRELEPEETLREHRGKGPKPDAQLETAEGDDAAARTDTDLAAKGA